MRQVFLAIFTLITVNAFAGTTIQYQAHAPAGTTINSRFSVYIADSAFDENSHLNSTALWYRENVEIEINNGIINYVIENVEDNILIDNYGKKLFVYAYVNGISLGRLQIRTVPYALLSTYALEAAEAKTATLADRANLAKRATLSDTATFSRSSIRSIYSDTSSVSDTANYARHANTSNSSISSAYSDLAGYSANSARSAKSDTTRYSLNGSHAKFADTSLFALDANHADFASTSAFATNATRCIKADTATFLVDSTITPRNVQRGAINVFALQDGETAQIGSYATRGTNGISWEVNPQHRTSSVTIHTIAPTTIAGDSRWVVSRVAVDYNIVPPTGPGIGQLITVFNGSTANTVTIKNVVWGTDTALDYPIQPNQSRTLWFNGAKWVVVE
jgi:hypothetical protein